MTYPFSHNRFSSFFSPFTKFENSINIREIKIAPSGVLCTVHTYTVVLLELKILKTNFDIYLLPYP